jgi:ZIP family zinc transporter/zinc and cadmium transporter
MLTAILYAALAGLGNVVGGALVVRSRLANSRRGLAALSGFGAGFMLAVALVGMLPESLEMRGGLNAVLFGYLIVHLTQHALIPHFHFGEETHAEAMTSRGIGVWALVGLLPHSFFDGVAISSGFLESETLGFFIFLAILLHKVPTGVSLASVMLASGNPSRRAQAAVLAVAAATILGAALTPLVGPLARWGLPVAAGVTIYVAASNLIPESQREHSKLVQGALFAGVLMFYVMESLLGH